MYYYRNRYYSSSLGRFLQTDPIGYVSGLNLYKYVDNNPVNWIDTLGLDKESVEQKSKKIKKKIISGVIANVSWVNPFTSSGGGVFGVNRMYPWDTGKGRDYAYDTVGRNRIGLDVGVAMESVWAYGSGDWSGEFNSINISFGPFAGSVFWSPKDESGDDKGWAGISIGLGVGMPGVAYEETTYFEND